MNAFIHEMEAEIAVGDTMRIPAFTHNDGSLMAVQSGYCKSNVESKFSTEFTNTIPTAVSCWNSSQLKC